MEIFRVKRSNNAGFADRSSSDQSVSSTPVSLDSKVQVQKQRNLPKLASDSSSCGSDSTDEDLLTFELEWRSSRRAVGTPMKKLLAQEMSRETESKRRAPSVIARLMGLDGLPPQQPAHKQQNKCLENHQHRTNSAAKAHKSGTFHGRRSFRKSSRDEEEFKDVFEVLDASKVESSSYPFQGTGYSNLTEADIAFIQQKFAYAKCFSTDEKLRQSEVLDDALEAQDSNNDLLIKFLQQPDALFTKHLHDLQGSIPQSQSGYGSALKSSHSSRYESNGLGQKYERETLCKSYSKISQKHKDGLIGHPHSRHVANNSPRSSKIQFEEQNEPAAVPTRIVVLKPNLGKGQNPAKPVSSPCSSHDFRTDCRLPGGRNQEAELRGKKKFPEVVSLTRHSSKEPRDIAKEVTRKMRSGIHSGSLNIPTSGFRGYAGDESSCDISGSESAYESDVTTISSIPVNWNSQYRCSSSRSTESYVSREAKKRLSERWKLTHRSQEMEVVSRGSTLGQMLAIPDKEIRPENLDGVMGQMGFNGKVFNKSGPRGWVEPLGISSRDGWKDGFVRNLSRSRSLPASSSLLGSPKVSMYYENLCDDRFKIPKEVVKRERSKSVKGTPNHKEFLGRSSRSSIKKSAQRSSMLCSDTSPELDFSQRKGKRKCGEDGPSEPNYSTSETHSTTSIDPVSVNENRVDAGHKKITVSSELSNLDLSTSSLLEGNLPAGDLEVEPPSEGSKGDCGPSAGDSFPHPVAEVQPSASAKEPDQPSPVSVLEAPFPDDLSSGSECFESLSADLHGLRMQLQLLKLESEAYEEGPMLISSDEDRAKEPTELVDELGIPKAEENFESLYLADVLTNSGFNDADADTFMARCHSPECPVSVSVFEVLEKKYCNLQSWSRSERRLLFDCINKKLLEIFEPVTDPHPWVRPATRVGHIKGNKDGLTETLMELVICRDKKAGADAGEMALSRESQWLYMGDDIDIIGREIERLLTDELVAEIMVM